MHIQKKWVSGVLSSLLFTLLLAACSSGGGDSAAPVVPAGTAEGQWTGTIAGRAIAGVVLDNETYWFWYSEDGNPLNAAGALQGQWDSSTQNGTFASLNGKAFRNDTGDIDVVPVTGPYVMKQKLDGEVTFFAGPGGTATFTSTFDSEYDGAPDIASVAGTYTGSVSANSQITPGGLYAYTIDVSASGTITVVATQVPPIANTSAIELGCDYAGTLIPQSHGNVYNITLTPSSTASTCTIAPLEGVAFFDTDPSLTFATKIYVLVRNSTSTRAFSFMGIM